MPQPHSSVHYESDTSIYSPVGSGKTALTLALCKRLRDDYNIGALDLSSVYTQKLAGTRGLT